MKFRALYRALCPALGRRAKAVATVSRFSADQLVSHGVCAREKITIIPDGHEHALRWSPRHSERTQGVVRRDTVMLIGSLAPHKNVDLILGLAGRLADAGLRIAVSGMSDPRVFNAGAPMPTANNIIWLGRLSDNELAAVLTDCLCLAFPSFTEGFGLPPLEAMALGCPVVASDRASLPEICGEAALYAAPNDADAWMRQLVDLRGNERLRAQLVNLGQSRAQRFSWRRSAEFYLELMARSDGISLSSQGEPKISVAPRACCLTPVVQEGDIVEGLQDLAVKALDREPAGVPLARRGGDEAEISLEQFDRIPYGRDGLVRKKDACWLVDIQGPNDIASPTSPEGDQGRAARLRLGQRDAKVLAACKNEGPGRRNGLNVFPSWQVAGELHVGPRERAQSCRLLPLTHHAEAELGHLIERLDDEVGALVRREE